MVVAKRVILRLWKSTSPPCFVVWLNYMIPCHHLEEDRYSYSYCEFVRFGGAFINYSHYIEDSYIV